MDRQSDSGSARAPGPIGERRLRAGERQRVVLDNENGRPILVPGMEPSPEGTVVSPAITGGSNRWSPTYSPRTDLIYVMAYDAETRYFIRPVEYQEGESYRLTVPTVGEPEVALLRGIVDTLTATWRGDRAPADIYDAPLASRSAFRAN